MQNYIVLTEVNTKSDDAGTRMDYMKSTTTVNIEDDFESARDLMRKNICKTVKKCEFFPLNRGHYEPFDEYASSMDMFEDDDEANEIKVLSKIIRKILTKPDYFCDDDVILDVDDDAFFDEYVHIIGKKDYILVFYYGKRLAFNVHYMEDKSKEYFFEYSEYDDYECRDVYSISIRLLKAKEKKKA